MNVIFFTDIHFGKRKNGTQHNQDCLDFITWALQIGKQYDCDTSIFGGDYHDNRTEINTKTLNYSQFGLELIDNAPHIKRHYQIIGNHDLHYRNTREVNSLPHARPFRKITIVNEPLRVGNSLLSPFLFPHEYDEVLGKTDADHIFGHFEFKGFVMAGGHYVMEHGPEGERYNGPKTIVTGHFHQRQIKKNIIYTGNTFPMDFSDANDTKRGVMIMDTDSGKYEFVDWTGGPSYVKCTLGELADSPERYLRPKAYVECKVDVDMTYLEAMELRKQMIEEFDLRAFELKDSRDEQREEALAGPLVEQKQETKVDDVGTMILGMLGEVKADTINNRKLQEMYSKA